MSKIDITLSIGPALVPVEHLTPGETFVWESNLFYVLRANHRMTNGKRDEVVFTVAMTGEKAHEVFTFDYGVLVRRSVTSLTATVE